MAVTPNDPALFWDTLLRGWVAGLLTLQMLILAAGSSHGARREARLAWLLFGTCLLAYLVCSAPAAWSMIPQRLRFVLLGLCLLGLPSLWLALKSVFDDHFKFDVATASLPVGVLVLGLVAVGDPSLPPSHQAAAEHPNLLDALWLLQLGVLLATAWEVLRGWQDDLVEPRRRLRRIVALGLAAYAAVTVTAEWALRGVPVGRLLPGLHVLVIGCIALALGIWVSRNGLAEVMGGGQPSATPVPDKQTIRAPLTEAAGHAAIESPEQGLPATPDGDKHPPQTPTLPTVSGGKFKVLLQRLDDTMRIERAYREEGLSLSALAGRLGVGEAQLRNLINQTLGFRNFNDFLHHHRLGEAAPRLIREDLPVLSIALDCGYGSIGPFNRAFKLRHGMTPTEYRAAHRLQPLAPPDS